MLSDLEVRVVDAALQRCPFAALAHHYNPMRRRSSLGYLTQTSLISHGPTTRPELSSPWANKRGQGQVAQLSGSGHFHLLLHAGYPGAPKIHVGRLNEICVIAK